MEEEGRGRENERKKLNKVEVNTHPDQVPILTTKSSVLTLTRYKDEGEDSIEVGYSSAAIGHNEMLELLD